MTICYDRTQRQLVYDAATAGDIPPEIVGEALLYVYSGKLKGAKRMAGLVSAGLVCRAWYPVAQRLIVSKRDV